MSNQRDEFARAALYGMLAHPTRYKPRHSENHLHWHEAIASEAYDIADAMIAASKRIVRDDPLGKIRTQGNPYPAGSDTFEAFERCRRPVY